MWAWECWVCVWIWVLYEASKKWGTTTTNHTIQNITTINNWYTAWKKQVAFFIFYDSWFFRWSTIYKMKIDSRVWRLHKGYCIKNCWSIIGPKANQDLERSPCKCASIARKYVNCVHAETSSSWWQFLGGTTRKANYFWQFPSHIVHNISPHVRF